MKRFSTFFLSALIALLALPLTASAEEALFDFQNNNGSWPVGEGANFADGDLKAPISMNGVTLTGIQGESANPVRLMTNTSKGTCLWLYKKTAVKFNAPEGKAITKIEFTMQTGSFDLEASTGAVAENVWTGNATEVTFGPNANGTRYLYAAKVTIADKNSETVEPAAEVFDVEAANIAAFLAAEDGKIVKLTLADAVVNAKKDARYFVEDASGAIIIGGVELTAGTKLTGYIIGSKSSADVDYVNDPSQAYEYVLTAESAENVEAVETLLTGTEKSIADSKNQACFGKLITLKDVTVSDIQGNEYQRLLTDGNGNTIKTMDYFGVLSAGYTWKTNLSSITGVIVYNMTAWFIMPISEAAIKAQGEQATIAIFDFTSENFREGIGEKLTDPVGYIINETFTSENVKLQITAGSAPSRIYRDATNGIRLAMYKEYSTLTFTAPEGYAITKIELNDKQSITYDFTVSGGTLTDKVWEGNVEGVQFLNNGTPYLTNAIVTLAPKNEFTTTYGIVYAECANIAAFNALEPGTYAKVTLTDAEVIGKSADGVTTVWIQDASAGCWIQYTSLNDRLQEKTKVNGTVYVVKRPSSVISQMKETEMTPNSELSATDITDYTMVENATAEELTVRATSPYLNRVVKITGASFKATKTTAGVLTLSDGVTTIDVTNGTATGNAQLHKLDDFTVDAEMSNVTIVAILVPNSDTQKPTENMLLPISMTTETNGIANVNAAKTADAVIFDLQGRQISQPTKGLYINNGKKYIAK